ncbi:MAG: aromatic amino acid transaminase [Rhizobiaceae bacterium]
MMFSDLPTPAPDPLLGLRVAFEADKSLSKVDLSIGVYRDDRGNVAILDCVRDAEKVLAERQTTKNYLSSSGNAEFNELTRALVLGGQADLISRARSSQTPGGSGALRVGFELIKRIRPDARAFVPTPTWVNHNPILNSVGMSTVAYPYYEIATGKLLFDEMMVALRQTTKADVVLLHACCHNPSGADLSLEQWAEVSAVLQKTGALPVIDMAYQGFGDGLDSDAAGMRMLARALPEVIVASSYSKNFAIYRERVGAITLIGSDGDAVSRAFGHLMPVIRTNYSMPPDHGAAVVAHVLSDARRRAGWEHELATMRNRINSIRQVFTRVLSENSNCDFGYLADQRGMFAMFAISPDAVAALRDRDHIHMSGSGRLNIAGLTSADVERVARALGEAMR